jgi:hypothetical protein
MRCCHLASKICSACGDTNSISSPDAVVKKKLEEKETKKEKKNDENREKIRMKWNRTVKRENEKSTEHKEKLEL